jgi:hypothetical protein
MDDPFGQSLLYGCTVYTMEDSTPREAILVEGEQIKAVGMKAQLETACSPECGKVDLGGAAVYPGFEDSHIHLASWCLRRTEIDLFSVKPLEGALELLREKAGRVVPGEWVRGGGWDKNVWGRFPTASDLDRIFPDNPVILGSKDGHSVWVNTRALREAGVTRETPEPPGGAILRDGSGNPSGILQDRAEGLVHRAVPPTNLETTVKALSDGMKLLLGMGVTAVQAAEGPDTLRALQILRERQGLPLRVTMMVPIDQLEHVAQAGLRYRFGDEWLKIGPVKMFKDGSLGASTAYMHEPYEGRPGYTGLQTMTPEENERAVAASVGAGFPVACHAIGDRACHEALDSIEKAGSPDAPGARHRIEHAQLLRPEDILRFRELGVVASVQPGHASADRYMAEQQWGKRARYAYAFRSLLESGAVLAFGSDAPVEVPDPLLGIYSAVHRKRPSEPQSSPWYPEESLSMFEAISGYTKGAAYAVGDEHLRGTITPGKLADLVVLGGDLFDAPENRIMGLEVREVMVGGKFALAEGSF